MNKIIVVLLLIGMLGVGALLMQQRQTSVVSETKETEKTQEQKGPQTTDTQTVSIEEIGMALKVPEGFVFSKERSMNFTTNEPYAVTFTIQNYENSPTDVENPYQLYGIYQWDTGEITEEEFRTADYMLDESTREEFSVDGLPAIKGLPKGERIRYTVYVLKDGHLLTLAADGTSSFHQETTDTILQSISFE